MEIYNFKPRSDFNNFKQEEPKNTKEEKKPEETQKQGTKVDEEAANSVAKEKLVSADEVMNCLAELNKCDIVIPDIKIQNANDKNGKNKDEGKDKDEGKKGGGKKGGSTSSDTLKIDKVLVDTIQQQQDTTKLKDYKAYGTAESRFEGMKKRFKKIFGGN